MQKRIVILVVVFILSGTAILADMGEIIFDGYSESLNELTSTPSMLQYIGALADKFLIQIKEALMPGFLRLTGYNDGTEVKLSLVSPSSFIGVLLSILITLECIILGIKSFLNSSCDFTSIVKHFVTISILLAFLSTIPVIGETILNIFSSAGVIAGGGESGTYFPFAPSSVIMILEDCKKALDIARTSLGSIGVADIPDILILSLATIIIAIPFLIVSVEIIFWYLEFYLIVLAGTIALPFSVFSYTSLTDIKTILKALLLEGVKIFLGVFFASLTGNLIKQALHNFNANAGGILNLTIYIFLITTIFVYGVKKGTTIFLSALSGTTDSTSSFTALSKGSMLLGAGAIISSSFRNPIMQGRGDKTQHSSTSGANEHTDAIINNPPIKEQPIKPNSPIQLPLTTEPPLLAPQSHTKQEETPRPLNTIPQSEKPNRNPIRSEATAKRIKEAFIRFENEGVSNATVEETKQRARWEATYGKLKKMEKKNFINKEGKEDTEAKTQFQHMTKEKKNYLLGKETWRGEKIRRERDDKLV